MRRVGLGMATAVLLAGLAVSGARAQDVEGDLHSAVPKPKAWYDGWFASAAKPTDAKPDAPGVTTHIGPSPVERAAAAHQQERADLDRRWEVCDRLMEIAVRNNDDAMQARVEQLRDRAWDIYQQRTANATASGPVTMPPPEKVGIASGRPAPKREEKP